MIGINYLRVILNYFNRTSTECNNLDVQKSITVRRNSWLEFEYMQLYSNLKAYKFTRLNTTSLY